MTVTVNDQIAESAVLVRYRDGGIAAGSIVKLGEDYYELVEEYISSELGLQHRRRHRWKLLPKNPRPHPNGEHDGE